MQTLKLDKALKYQKEGEHLETYELLMVPPSYKSAEFVRWAKQNLTRAINELSSAMTPEQRERHKAKAGESDIDEEMDGESLMMMLCSLNVAVFDYDGFVKRGISGLINFGLVKVDDGVNLTKSHIESLDDPDIEETVLGEYLANFIWEKIISGGKA